MKTNKILYQWDAGQKLTDCKGVFVDFVISGDVYRCDVVNGECIVPDELLQHPGKQTAYECMADNTLQEFVFSVVPRPLPPDYVYTPTEKLTFEGLVQKVEDTVADIIRRADSGEFDGYTPVKGKDYFTESEKNEMMQRVSSGAIGEFREVVNSATAGFNKNSSAKTNDYNANAEKKVGVYDSNAAEKLKAYNDNHTDKMTAYDVNASDKIAEFDAHAAELQTEVNNLKAEGTTLREEAGKQEHRIDALMKLNKGQTYDVIEDTTPAHAKTVLSGTHYASIEKIGGKSLVWNQLAKGHINNDADNIVNLGDGTSRVTFGTRAGRFGASQDGLKIGMKTTAKQKYLYWVHANCENGELIPQAFSSEERVQTHGQKGINSIGVWDVAWCIFSTDVDTNVLPQFHNDTTEGLPHTFLIRTSAVAIPLVNLTQMFGAGNEPSTYEEFESLLRDNDYSYNNGEIVSSTTSAIEVYGKNLWDDSAPAFTKVLTNSGFVNDGKQWIASKVLYIATQTQITKGATFSYDIKCAEGINARFKFTMSNGNNVSTQDFISDGSWKHHSLYLPYDAHTVYIAYSSRGVCEIKNIQLERGTAETAYSPHTKQSITTGFPELRSALEAHDCIDMDGGKIHRKIKSTRIDGNTPIYSVRTDQDNCCRVVFTPETSPGIVISEEPTIPTNIISDKLATITHNNYWSADAYTGIEAYPGYASISMRLQDRTDLDTKEKVSAWIADNPMTVYYEAKDDDIADIVVPEQLREWIEVETGSTVVFGDDTRFLIPNTVKFVRKLNEGI